MVGFGLTKSLFVRHKLGLALTLSFLLVASISLLAIGKQEMPALASVLIFLGFILACFYLLAVFLHSDSDVATPGSTYPSHYFTLPVKTSELVLWPVLSGIVVVGLVTFLVSFAIDKAHYDFNYLGATFVMVTLLTTMQAVFWFPVGIPYSKLVLSVSVITGIFFLGIAPSVWKIDVGLQFKLYALVIATSVALTWVGVGKARTGRSIVGQIRPIISWRKAKVALPAFKNPFQAQVWYEWRQQGRILPIVTFLFITIFLGVSLTNDTISPIGVLFDEATLSAPMASTFLSVYYPMLIVLMGIFAWVVGFGMKRTEVKRNDGSFHLFFATRPLTDEQMVWAKMKVALKSTAIAWGMLLLATLPLLGTPSAIYNQAGVAMNHGMLIDILPRFITPDIALKGSCAVLVFFLLTWRNFAIGFWTELSGNTTLRYVQPFLSVVLYASIAAMPKSLQADMSWVPWVLGGGVIAKVVVAGWTAFSLRSNHQISVRSLTWVIAGYLAGVLIIGACVFNLMQSQINTPKSPTDPANVLTVLNTAFIVVLYVPLARILLAVKSLSLNRHR